MALRGFGRFRVGVGLLFFLCALRPMEAQTVSAVPKLDLNQITGTWYEIARYPNKGQKHCTGDAFELVTTRYKARRLLLVDSCLTKTGYTDVRNRTAKQDKSGSGRLKVSSFWPFSSKNWVLALGPDASWSLVGGPNRKQLWVLSRTTGMAPEVLAEVKRIAAAQGFATDKLVLTPQRAR